MFRWCGLILLVGGNQLVHVSAVALRAGSASRANPIRKVVNLLNSMETKIQKEGKEAEAAYEKYMCYCKTSGAAVEKSIKAAEDKIPQLESSITEAESTHQQLTEDLKQHQADRTTAKDTEATAIAMREKEAKAYADESTTLKANIKALGEAIAAISKGIGASFLQTPAAKTLQALTISMDMAAGDRDVIVSFLEQTDGEEYAPQSGEILGILKQLGDTMKEDLADVEATEKKAIASHESLLVAKKKEIAAATKAIEQKTGRAGEVAVEIVTLKNDLSTTEESLAEDQKFAAGLGKSCKDKQVEWVEYQKVMSAEVTAITDTIKTLNDDDALELFKKTLTSSSVSFIQLPSESAATLRRQAAAVLRRKGDHRLDLLEMALRGQTAGFDSVMKDIDNLVSVLDEEQTDDDKKKTFCLNEIDKVEDEKKVTERDIADSKTAIDDSTEKMTGLLAEIQAIKAGLKQLTADVEEQTTLRKLEHANTVEALSTNNAAKQLLEVAKNRLAQYYTPSTYKPKKEVELAADDQVVVNLGGTAPPTPAPGGIANTGILGFLQVSSSRQDPPEADLTYNKQSDAHGGIVAMINMLQDELKKEITVLETEEKESQADYEAFIADSSAKRITDAKSLANKEGEKAGLAAKLQKQNAGLRSQTKSLQSTDEELASLHAECDWLLANFDLRKDARAEEVDALQKAKAVLSGADYSF